MLFDIGWPELLLIGAVALVVIGPKDLPRALRVAGFWVKKARNMSREFQSSVDQMIRDAELDDMRKDIHEATQFDLEHQIRNTVDPGGDLEDSLKPSNLPDYFDETLPGLEPPAADPLALEPSGAQVAASGTALPEAPPDLAAEPELPFPEPTSRGPEPSPP